MKPLLLLLALTTVWLPAQGQDHRQEQRSESSGDEQIIVIINPEARISAVMGTPLPPPPTCGSAMVLKLKVINQSLITAPLRATLVETASKHVTLYMDSSKLSGEPQDSRLLHLIPERSGLFDVTIAFSIDSNVGDLGGRDRIHLLVRCENRS